MAIDVKQTRAGAWRSLRTKARACYLFFVRVPKIRDRPFKMVFGIYGPYTAAPMPDDLIRWLKNGRASFVHVNAWYLRGNRKFLFWEQNLVWVYSLFSRIVKCGFKNIMFLN